MNLKIFEILQTNKKKYNRLNSHKTNFVNEIIDCVGKVDCYYYWPLCLDDARDRNSLEIDTCSTSYCISILSVLKNQTDTYDYNEYIRGGLNTLLKLRQKDGTFPPVIEIDSLNKRSVEYTGGIAMSDNYFALTAFLDAGFLNENFEYDDLLPKELKGFKDRVKFIFETVKFFNNSMICQKSTGESQSGWYYTNDKNAENPAFLTTINIVLLLNRIINILNKFDTFDNEITYIKNIAKKGIDFLSFNTKSINLNGDKFYGIGEKIGFDKISLIHTCKMVDAFISINNPDLNDEIADAVLTTILKMCEDWFFADTYNYSERFQLLKNDKTKYQNILHESYPESTILYTIINVLKYSLTDNASTNLKKVIFNNIDAISSIMDKLIERLENQRSRVEKFNGFFKSHIRRNDGDYPIYASAESYKAIIAWENLHKQLDELSDFTATSQPLTIKEAINFQNTLIAQIARLQTYKNDPNHIANPAVYDSSIKECERLIGKVENMLNSLSDANYAEQRKKYDDNLLKHIQTVIGS